MCGRFAFYSPREAVARLFGVADAPEVELDELDEAWAPP